MELSFLCRSGCSRARISPPRGPRRRLVRRRRDDVGDRHRVRVDARRDEAGDVRHVDHEPGADGICDRAESLPVDHARVGRESGEDHLRPVLAREPLDLRVVDLAGRRIEAVLDGVEDLAGEVHLRAVGQMAAMVEAHPEQRVARGEQREIDGCVRLRAGVRLYVGVRGTEKRLRALDREFLGDVDELAATVVALARVALGVLVGEYRALRLQHPRARIVLRGDELEVLLLAAAFRGDRGSQPGVECLDAHAGTKHGFSRVSALKWSAKSTRCAGLRPPPRRLARRPSRHARCCAGCSRRRRDRGFGPARGGQRTRRVARPHGHATPRSARDG